MPGNYYELYFPLLLQVFVGLAMAAGMVGTSWILGQHVRNKVKDMPYESGMNPVGNARERFSVKFYLVAIVFILFDIEAIFLYPWATVYREFVRGSGLLIFWEMVVFVVLVLCGFFYILKKGVLDWAVEKRAVPAQDAESVIRKYAA